MSTPSPDSLHYVLLEACKKLDTDNTGILTYDQLKSVLSSQGEDVSTADIEEMVEETKAKPVSPCAKAVASELQFPSAFEDPREQLENMDSVVATPETNIWTKTSLDVLSESVSGEAVFRLSSVAVVASGNLPYSDSNSDRHIPMPMRLHTAEV